MEENFNLKPLVCEYQVARIISEQAKWGCNFDIRKAQWCAHLLTEQIARIDIRLIPMLPKMRVVGTSYQKPFLKNGKFSKYVQQFADEYGLAREDVGGPFTALVYKPFDPSKNQRVKAALMDYGWLPNEWNSKKVDWDTFKVSRCARGVKTYKQLRERLQREAPEELVLIEEELDKFLKKHFKDKTVNYMKAYLWGLGFNVRTKKTPTFDEIKLAFAKQRMRVTGPKISKNEDADDDGDFDITELEQDLGPVGNLLKDRVVKAHRLGLINGLIKVMRPDGKISGEANSCATPTFRFKHKKIVNIPAVGAFFGEECRSMFMSDYTDDSAPMLLRNEIPKDCFIRPNTNLIVTLDKKGKEEIVGHWKYFIPKGRAVFVGYDGSGLELRMLAHYLIKECTDMLNEALVSGNAEREKRARAGLESALRYREVLLTGDIHTHNQHLAGLPTRKAAKSFIYAFNYGAGDAKLGSLVNGGKDEGAIIRARFLKECPCIAILIERMQDKARVGYLIGVDGRRITMRRDERTGAVMVHKALNTLLQSAGAIVMKYAMILLDKWCVKRGIRFHKVIDMHDEGQITCHRDDWPVLKELCEKCVTKAGEYLKMDCILASEAKVGANWCHTH